MAKPQADWDEPIRAYDFQDAEKRCKDKAEQYSDTHTEVESLRPDRIDPNPNGQEDQANWRCKFKNHKRGI